MYGGLMRTDPVEGNRERLMRPWNAVLEAAKYRNPVIANDRFLAPLEPGGLARNGDINPVVSAPPQLQRTRRVFLRKAIPHRHVLSERCFGNSAEGNDQLIAAQERDADVGGTRSNQRENIAALEDRE